MTSIRHLQPDEDALFFEMLALFGDAFDDSETYRGNQPGPAYVRRLLANDDFITLVAVNGDAVVGALTAYVLRKFERERSEVYIYDLAVAEPHRRKGVATTLIEALKPLAAARDAWVIFVQADHVDAPAIALYTKLGAREDVLHFDIPIDPSSSAG